VGKSTVTANLAVAIEPFLPFTADKISTMLGGERPGWDSLGRADLLAPGHTVTTTPGLLFERIEDAAIETQIEKLKK
jgi:methionyl-tRNA synthetase